MIVVLFLGIVFVFYFNRYMENQKHKKDVEHFEKTKEKYDSLLAGLRKKNKIDIEE